MGSAPLLQADSNIGTINTSELKSPHCIPVSTSGAIKDRVIRLPAGKPPAAKHPGAIGGPQNHACWCMKTSSLTLQLEMAPPPPPPQFQGAMHELEPHMPPLSMESFHPHLAAPHYLSFTARFSSPSHFKCTIPVDHSLQVQAANGHIKTTIPH